MREIIGYGLLLIVCLVVFLLAPWWIASQPREVTPQEIACKEAHGHWVQQSAFVASECWSEDGTRRIFPWETK